MSVRKGLQFESSIESDCAPLADLVQLLLKERIEIHGEILGLDPLYVANEGRFVAFVPASDVDRALRTMRSRALGAEATHIGVVTTGTPGLVTLKTQIGARRILDLLSGEQLPRIC